MSSMTIPEPEILFQPFEDGRRTTIRKRVVMAALGLTAFSGIALAIGANSTPTSPMPVTVRSEPAISPWLPQTNGFLGACLADIECLGESRIAAGNSPPQQPADDDVLERCMRGGVDCPAVAIPQAPGPDHTGAGYITMD